MEEPKRITVRMVEDDEEAGRVEGEKLAEAKPEAPVVPLKQGERNVFKRYKGHVKGETAASPRVLSVFSDPL